MISRIRISNFQSLAEADLELGAWLSLVGQSDVGKSAIVRAVCSLLLGARGEYFIRAGEPECSVAVTLDDGTTITWRKPRGRSATYSIDGHDYSAASGVPDEVRRLLPVTLMVGDDEITPGIATQLAPPFLLADTPRRRAQILGGFDGSSILLAADGAVRRRQREAQAHATERRADAEAAREQARGFSWLADAQPAAVAAKAALERATDSEQHLAAATALTDALEGNLAESARLDVLATALDVSAAADPLARAELHRQRIGRIEDAGRQANAVTRAIAAVGRYEQPDLDPYLPRLERLAAGAALLVEAAALWTAEDQTGSVLGELNAEVRRAHDALEQLVGSPCPVCGNVIGEGVLA